MTSEESTTPDLAQLTRQSMEASNRREFDVSATKFAPDAVFDVTSAGLGRFEGATAIHGYLADWYSSYEKQELREWEGTTSAAALCSSWLSSRLNRAAVKAGCRNDWRSR